MSSLASIGSPYDQAFVLATSSSTKPMESRPSDASTKTADHSTSRSLGRPRCSRRTSARQAHASAHTSATTKTTEATTWTVNHADAAVSSPGTALAA